MHVLYAGNAVPGSGGIFCYGQNFLRNSCEEKNLYYLCSPLTKEGTIFEGNGKPNK